jgi:hypothetical protein
VDLVKQRLDERAAGLNAQVPWTLPALQREWNSAKQQAAPWWRENSKEAYSSGLDALARGLKNWSETVNARGGDASPGPAGQTPPKREPRTSGGWARRGPSAGNGLLPGSLTSTDDPVNGAC